MSGTPMDQLRAYFEARNQAWTTGDIQAAARVAQVNRDAAWWRITAQSVRAKQQLAVRRRAQIVRAHTKVRAVAVPSDVAGADRKTYAADEEITWVYADGPDFGVEARLFRHRQIWLLRQGAWRLAEDVVAEEGLDRRLTERTYHLPDPVSRERDRIPLESATRSCTTYDRVRAIRYAELWWNGANPAFARFDSDCTNFVSQCLWAGNMRMVGGQDRSSGWWYRFSRDGRDDWSYSWTTAHALNLFLQQRARAKQAASARDLKLGDVILYDWEGTGRYHHSALVTDFDHRGDPLVNAHTADSYHRHYLYLDSPAWTPKTKYLFLHLPDELCV